MAEKSSSATQRSRLPDGCYRETSGYRTFSQYIAMREGRYEGDPRGCQHGRQLDQWGTLLPCAWPGCSAGKAGEYLEVIDDRHWHLTFPLTAHTEAGLTCSRYQRRYAVRREWTDHAGKKHPASTIDRRIINFAWRKIW